MSSYTQKVQQAVKLIEGGLNEDLNWKSISRNCAISEYHFHRIFSAVMKETPRDYIIRRRLEKAMAKIVYGQGVDSFVDIAMDSGYSSQSNFSKAFKAYFGITPKQAQERTHPKDSKIGKIKSKYGKDFAVEDLYPKQVSNSGTQKGEISMKAEVKKIGPREVIYDSSPGGYALSSIRETWIRLMTSLAELGNKPDELTKFGIGHDNPQVTPEDKCRYDACVLLEGVGEVPAYVKKMTIPGGKFVCFYYKGQSSGLLDMYLKIYSEWFPENGYEPGDFPLIERYIFVDKDNPDADMEVETQFLVR